MEQSRIIFPLRHEKIWNSPKLCLLSATNGHFYLKLNFGKQILLNNCQKRACQTCVRSAPAVSESYVQTFTVIIILILELDLHNYILELRHRNMDLDLHIILLYKDKKDRHTDTHICGSEEYRCLLLFHFTIIQCNACCL